jgi:hypothetical protein
VQWAIDHHEEIMAAARLRHDVDALSTMSSTVPEVDTDLTTGMAHALIGRLAQLRRVGPHGESFPLILDDPFIELDSAVKPSLLELLGRGAGQQQIVFLTEDEDVASWARLEALTGELSILEPTVEPQPTQVGRRTRVAG